MKERDYTKLDEMILYIASKCASDSSFGITKLNKIIFFADREYYARHRRGISGDGFIRQPQGPVPTHLERRLKRLVSEKRAVNPERTYHGFKQRVVFSLDEPNLDLFLGSEIAVIDEVIERYRGRTASSASEESHEFLAWKCIPNGKDLPLSSTFLYRPAVTSEMVEFAKDEIIGAA